MKKGYLYFLLILILSWLALVLLALPIMKKPNDFAEVNYIRKSVEKNWGHWEDSAFRDRKSNLSFYVINEQGDIVYESMLMKRSGLEDSIKNKDTIIDIVKNEKVVGKLIVLNEDYERYVSYSIRMRNIYLLINSLFFIIIAILVFEIWRTILQPLDQLKVFAERISDGNLEMPLSIHSNNALSTFANSFDIMREKLLNAKINEQNALKKRKELIASLSHDIKTPIASIKATTELLALQEDNLSKRKKMMIIMDKAEQINLLASNLLQSTLDELEEMEFIVREECSEVVTDIIRSADYKNYIREISIPSCIIKIDKNRLLQVFDNIINNSYKYANTEITVSSCFSDQYLRISVSDFGDCIEEDEIHLVDQRFYRGKKAKDFAGSGLGLYICKKIIDKIGGRIRFDKIENQFCVTIDLPLA